MVKNPLYIKYISDLYGDFMVHLERESLNSLFEVLEEWERHLAQHDLSDLRCDDEDPAP